MCPALLCSALSGQLLELDSWNGFCSLYWKQQEASKSSWQRNFLSRAQMSEKQVAVKLPFVLNVSHCGESEENYYFETSLWVMIDKSCSSQGN